MDLSKIQSQLDSAKSEVEQLKLGRKVSSSRARAALMKIKKESDLIRKEILTYSKSLPVKQRKTKVAVSPVISEPSGSVSELQPSGSVSELPPAVVLPEKSVEALPKAKTKSKAKPKTKN
jgi:hypothetical protein